MDGLPWCFFMQPVASVCKVSSLHLMSLAVETFSEESLGNSEVCALETQGYVPWKLRGVCALEIQGVFGLETQGYVLWKLGGMWLGNSVVCTLETQGYVPWKLRGMYLGNTGVCGLETQGYVP